MEQTVFTVDDAPIYIFNEPHRNFVQTMYRVPKGSEIKGKALKIEGLRRGQPFTYRVFITNDKKIIFLNKTNIQMNPTTDITLGADGSKVDPSQNNPSSVLAKTTINIPLGSATYKNTLYASIIGAGAGFGFAKYKKFDQKKSIYYSIGGAIAGALIGLAIDKKVIVIKKN